MMSTKSNIVLPMSLKSFKLSPNNQLFNPESFRPLFSSLLPPLTLLSPNKPLLYRLPLSNRLQSNNPQSNRLQSNNNTPKLLFNSHRCSMFNNRLLPFNNNTLRFKLFRNLFSNNLFSNNPFPSQKSEEKRFLTKELSTIQKKRWKKSKSLYKSPGWLMMNMKLSTVLLMFLRLFKLWPHNRLSNQEWLLPLLSFPLLLQIQPSPNRPLLFSKLFQSNKPKLYSKCKLLLYNQCNRCNPCNRYNRCNRCNKCSQCNSKFLKPKWEGRKFLFKK